MQFAICWRTAGRTRRLGSGPASAAGTAAPASPPPATAARKEPGVERESGERGPAATPSRVTAAHVRRPTGACTRQSAGRARHLVRRARGTSPARHQPTRHQPMRERRTAPGGVRDVAARPGGSSRERSTPPDRVGPRRSTAGGGGGREGGAGLLSARTSCRSGKCLLWLVGSSGSYSSYGSASSVLPPGSSAVVLISGCWSWCWLLVR